MQASVFAVHVRLPKNMIYKLHKIKKRGICSLPRMASENSTRWASPSPMLVSWRCSSIERWEHAWIEPFWRFPQSRSICGSCEANTFILRMHKLAQIIKSVYDQLNAFIRYCLSSLCITNNSTNRLVEEFLGSGDGCSTSGNSEFSSSGAP